MQHLMNGAITLYTVYAMHHSMLPGTTWHFTQLGNGPTCAKHATCAQEWHQVMLAMTKDMTVHLFCKGV